LVQTNVAALERAHENHTKEEALCLNKLKDHRPVADVVGFMPPECHSGYPITPQTHIVEDLAEIVSEGRLKAEFVNVESEFAAASVVLGAQCRRRTHLHGDDIAGNAADERRYILHCGYAVAYRIDMCQQGDSCSAEHLERSSGFYVRQGCRVDSASCRG